MENVWADPTDKLFAYLQCRYGEQHHSFIFVDGQFLGNGFAFDTNNPRAQYGGNRGVPNGRFEALADAAGARRTCPFVGLQNLRGARPLLLAPVWQPPLHHRATAGTTPLPTMLTTSAC